MHKPFEINISPRINPALPRGRGKLTYGNMVKIKSTRELELLVGKYRKIFVSTFQSKKSGFAKILFNKPGKATWMEMGEGAMTTLGQEG